MQSAEILNLEQPSLLDLYNWEEIDKLLPESIKYLLRIVLTNYHSNKTFMLLYNHFEDFYFCLNLIVNYFILNHTNSTFLGNNFGISYQYRDRYIDKNDYILFILFDIYGERYVFHKLDSYKESLVNEYKLIKKNYKTALIKDNGKFWEDNIDTFKKKLAQQMDIKKCSIMLKLYPTLKRYYKIVKLIMKICYYKNITYYYTPLQYLLNIKMVKSSSNSSLSSRFFVILSTVLRAIEYYNRENLVSSLLARDRDLVDSVPLPKSSIDYKGYNIKQSKCPLCFKNYRNPTCVEENGLVFCYNCIYDNLEFQRNKNTDKLICPITKVKLRHGFNSLTRLLY